MLLPMAGGSVSRLGKDSRTVTRGREARIRELIGLGSEDNTIDSEMSGSKARHSTLKACTTSRLDVATNGDTARKDACATSPGRSESLVLVWDSLLG